MTDITLNVFDLLIDRMLTVVTLWRLQLARLRGSLYSSSVLPLGLGLVLGFT